MVLQSIGATLGANRLAFPRLHLKRESTGLRVTNKWLSPELTTDLIEKSKMTGTTEFPKKSLIPGHGTFDHGPILEPHLLQLKVTRQGIR